MNTLEFSIEAAYRNDYTHVITMGGAVKLEHWTPYGKREGHMVSFAYCGDEIREYLDDGNDACNVPIYLGVWKLSK